MIIREKKERKNEWHYKWKWSIEFQNVEPCKAWTRKKKSSEPHWNPGPGVMNRISRILTRPRAHCGKSIAVIFPGIGRPRRWEAENGNGSTTRIPMDLSCSGFAPMCMAPRFFGRETIQWGFTLTVDFYSSWRWRLSPGNGQVSQRRPRWTMDTAGLRWKGSMRVFT